MALIVGVGILVNTLIIRPQVLSYATNMSSSGLLLSTNAERTNNNLSNLTINTVLNQAAQAKAEDMVARNYWSHNTPDGKEPWIFFDNAGYQYLAAGENLAYGFTSSADAVTGWMNSPGHRANILNTEYQEVGFGIANSPDYQSNGNETIVVAMYGKPASGVTQAAQSTPQNTVPNTTITKSQPIIVEDTAAPDSSLKIRATVPKSHKVTRVQLATSGFAPWSIFATSAFVILALLFLVTRHSLAWHRTLVKGESFILKHKFLDIILVASIMIAAMLSQTAGFIQ